MAPQKSPAFQFYPKDFMAGTATMSNQEVGAYVRLLCYEWDAGSVPNDARERSRIITCSLKQERTLWHRLERKFALVDGVFVNERMEQERQKQAEYRRRQSEKGKASATVRWSPDGNRKVTTVTPRLQPDGNSSSSSSSSSSVPPSKNDGGDALPRPLVSGEASPRGWGKIHGDHVAGFCDWVCLPEFVFAEFVRKSAGAEYVRQWAARVRKEWEGKTVGDNLKFWRVRWSETHPEIAAKPKPEPINTAKLLEQEAHRKAIRLARETGR